MTDVSILNLLQWAEVPLCVATLCFLVLRKQWRDYWALGAFLAIRVTSSSLPFLIHQAGYHYSRVSLYKAYFWIYWSAFAIESILGLFILYGIFRITTIPLKGLQRFGLLLLGIVAVLFILLAFGWAFSSGSSGMKYVIASISQLQEMQSILTLGLALFVGLAIKAMGLSYKSRVFGVSLGLAIMAIANLMQTAWLAHNARSYGFFNLVDGLVICATFALWAGYFAMREPERREIVLPASSVFARLNRMGMAWSVPHPEG